MFLCLHFKLIQQLPFISTVLPVIKCRCCFFRPYWYQSPLSTTIPLDPSSPGAMNYSLWMTLGTEVLLKSDLVNWYICKDLFGYGSIVKWNDGYISCRVAKIMVAECSRTAPNHVGFDEDYGLKLTYYMYDILYKVAVMASSKYQGGRIMNSCLYDPDGIVKGLSDPRGAWFVR